MRKRAGAVFAISLFLLLLAAACGGAGNPFGVKSERFFKANNVAAMAFAPDGRLFFAQQFTGDIRIINADGTPQAEPFAHVDPALYLEWGLTGLALDPAFEENHYVYAYYTELVREEERTASPAPAITASPAPGIPVSPASPPPPTTIMVPIGKPVVARFTELDGKGVEPMVIVGGLPETFIDHPGFNANGKIHFGPDGYLYVSLGDYDIQATEPNHPSQDLSTPIGKLLRVSKEDGSAAPGNPFADRAEADPRIFAYGFREPFDFTFHPQTGAVYGTDNTPVSCEELNMIVPGANYGWPSVGTFPFPECGAGSQQKPIHFFSKEGSQPGDFLSFVEVSALAFVSASTYPTLGDSLLVCQLASADPPEPRLRRVVLSGAGFDQVTADEVVVKDCRRGVAIGPGGVIFYSTDKEIRRLIPPEAAATN